MKTNVSKDSKDLKKNWVCERCHGKKIIATPEQNGSLIWETPCPVCGVKANYKMIDKTLAIKKEERIKARISKK